MRLSVVLLACSLLGVLAGGWLTGRLGFGLAVIGVSVAVGAWALFHDDGRDGQPREVQGTPTLYDVLQRARRSA